MHSDDMLQFKKFGFWVWCAEFKEEETIDRTFVDAECVLC